MALSLEERKELLKELKRELLTQKVYVETCREGVDLPENTGTSGFIVKSCENKKIKPGESTIVSTGLKLTIPEDSELLVRSLPTLTLETPLRVADVPVFKNYGSSNELGIVVTNYSQRKYRLHKEFQNRLCDFRLMEDRIGKPQDYQLVEDEPIGPLGITRAYNRNGTYEIRVGDEIARIVLVKYQAMSFERSDRSKRL